MRKIILTTALVAGFAALGSALPGSANAMTISTPAALTGAAGDSNVTDVAYVCRTWWRYGHRHRSCSWRPGPYASYGYGSYGYRRHHYHHRHWY